MGPEDQVTELDRLKAEALRLQIQTDKARSERQQAQGEAQRGSNVPPGYVFVQNTADGGKIYKAPDGKLSFTSSGYATNNQDEIQRMMQGAAPAAARRTETNKQIVEQGGLQAGAASAMQGIPFVGQYFDEAVGMMTGDPRATAAIRENQAAYQEQKPVEAFAGQALLGAGATLPFIPVQAAGRALQAAPTLGKAIVGATGVGIAGGAVEGAVSGFGAGEGSFEERLPSAYSGAGFGAGFGALFGAASAPVSFAVENMVKFFGNEPSRKLAKDLGIDQQAAKVLQLFLKEGDIDSARAALNRAGSQSMLAEVNQSTKNLLDAAIQLGSGSDAPLKALDARAITSNKELTEGLNKFFGVPRDLEDVKGEIWEATEKARKDAYDAAFASPINYNSVGGQNLLRQGANLSPDVIAAANKLMQTDPFLTTKPPPMKLKTSPAAKAPAAAGAAPPARPDPTLAMITEPGDQLAYINKKYPPAAANLQPPYFTAANAIKRANGDRAAATKELQQYADYLKKTKSAPEVIENAERTVRAVADVDPIYFDDAAFNASMKSKIEAGGTAAMEQAGVAPPTVAQFETPPTVMQWDYIARALQGEVDSEEVSVLGRMSQQARNYDGTRRAIREELKAQIPMYKQALGLAGGTQEEGKALELGSNILRKVTTVGDVLRAVKDAEPPELAAMKQGIRTYVDQTLGDLRDRAINPNTDIKELSAALELLRSRNNMDKVKAVLGQADADEFYKLLDEQATTVELRAAVVANSKTAQRQALGQTVNDITTNGILGELGRGKAIDVQQRLVQSMTGLTPEADAVRRMGMFDDVASVLTRLQGQGAKDALEMIELARRGRVLTEPQARIIAKQVTMPAAMALYAPIMADRVKPVRPQEATYGRQATE